MVGLRLVVGCILPFASFFTVQSARVAIQDDLFTASSSKVFQDAQMQRQTRLSLANKYDGWKLISAHIKTMEDVEALKKILQDHEGEIDTWSENEGPAVGRREDLMMGPGSDAIIEAIRAAGLATKVMIHDVGASVKEEAAMNHAAFSASKDIVGKFASLEEINEWMSNLATEHDHVQVESIGKSFLGRPINMLRIASPAAQEKKAPIMLMECAAHAREWASPAACVWMINLLLTSTDSDTKRLAETLEWHFIPVLNVDGYKYTHDADGDRLWRKNRRNDQGECDGVDLNRNYDYVWGTAGVSWDKCSAIYPGTGPFSEPETQALKEHVLKFLNGGNNRIQAYIAIHAYCSVWLHPPGAGPPPSDYEELARAGDEAAKLSKALHGQPFRAGSGPGALYAAGGISQDWVHAEKGGNVKYTYTPELRPNDVEGGWERGFLLPLNEVPMASEEAWAGTKYIAEIVAKDVL